jgi:hypothetical protein
MCHEIDIKCSTEQLFNYVTQPWRWHEWHPDSKGACAGRQVLSVGDTFDETIEIQPLPPLPLTLTRHPRYVVLESMPYSRWSAEGSFSDGWLSFRYEIEPTNTGVVFRRTMRFEVRGLMRLLVPLVRMKQERKSRAALAALKRLMEAQPGSRPPDRSDTRRK